MWQPIETAPMEIDLICKWKEGMIERASLSDDGEDYVYHVLFDGEQYRTMPIAWMYIPDDSL